MTAPLGADDPTRLGRYTLLGRLGEGGMGTVYLGRGRDDRLVAVKVIRADLARIPEFRTRFRREADLARRIARFCTAEVLDVVDPPNESPYLVTEFVDGPTLAQAVATGGPLSSADLERVAVSVAAALTAIHSAGLVHRDLKPSNVLLSPLGPRVIDFGIARALDSTTMISQDVQRVGTPAFMAPEQVDGDAITAAADIFSWGGLVTFAGTGRYPFGDGPSAVQLYRVVHNDPHLDSLDEALRPIVEQSMRKDPAARPSAQELFLKLVNLGSATHPDPEVTALIHTSNAFGSPVPASSTGPSGTGSPGGTAAPPPDLGSSPTRTSQPAPPAGAGWNPPAPPPGLPPTPPGPTPTPRPTGPTPTGPTPTPAPSGAAGRRRRRTAVAAVGAAVVLVTAAVVVPVIVLRGGGTSTAQVAALAAEQAERTRATDSTTAKRLSLAAYRISPGPEARRSLITSFAGPEATIIDGHTTSVLGVAVSRDGRMVASASADNTVGLWDITDRHAPVALAVLRGHTDWVIATAFSPDGRTLVTTSNDKSAILWDITNPLAPTQLSTILGHTGNVYDAQFSPDGRRLATTGYDNTARIWDVTDPTEPVQMSVLNRHINWINEVAFSPDGTLVATASADKSLRLWDITKPTEPRALATMTAHDDFVWTVAFSPDGRTLASGGFDGKARLWNVADPAQPTALGVIDADTNDVYDLDFSPDGRTLATGGWETTVKLWDVTDPAAPVAVGVIGGHADWVQSVAFLPDSSSIVSGSDDRTVRLTSVDPETVAREACLVPGNHISQEEWDRLIPDAPYQPVC